jgi:hypothetical protein
MTQNGKPEIRDVAWRCPACDSTLGYTGSDRKVLRMKYKDFYVFIVEAQNVITFCRRCGRECVLSNLNAQEE